jgi:hypothetical protein
VADRFNILDTPAASVGIAAHEADTTSVHGVSDTSALATTAALTTHDADTTSVHGIANTAALLDAGHTGAADPHTGYVLESLFDAAGDLVVASAADTPSKLAMGSGLQVLRVNSGATGLEYATLSTGVAEGRAVLAGVTQLSMPGIEGSATATNTMGANEIRYSPWYVATPITIDSLWVEVSTAGAAGKLIRIGLYNADGGWNPTSLVTDGAVAADGALGVRTLNTGSLALPAGRYLTAVNTDGTPALRGMRGSNKYFGYAVALGSSQFITNWLVARAYGAMPDPGDAPTGGSASSSLFINYVYCRITTP